MTNLIEVEFVGGPWDGPGYVHPLANALYLPVDGHPEGYYMTSGQCEYTVTEEGQVLSRYYWMPAVTVTWPQKKEPWWQKLLNFFQ